MSNQLLREALEEMVRCAQKQNWRDNYPSAMDKAYAALDATKQTQPAAGEPIHQWEDQGLWMDGDEADMASARAEGFKTRTLWTAPPAAAHGDDGRTCRFCQKRFDSAGECGNHVDQFHHGEAEQQEAARTCSDERPCVNCFADNGDCLGPDPQVARNAEVARESLRPENQRIEPVEPLRVPHPLEAQGAQAGEGGEV